MALMVFNLLVEDALFIFGYLFAFCLLESSCLPLLLLPLKVLYDTSLLIYDLLECILFFLFLTAIQKIVG